MAKLSSYYTLCPLIDQQSLLGVEKDSDPGCAIVTLGKNIVIRYKLQDLKQVNSWSSRERLTTQVIYDQTSSQYAAVFNGNHVRVWSEGDSDLDKVKRHKFNFTLHTIVTLEGHPPVLVRQNGATGSLAWALENRKSWSSQGVLKKDENIVDCQLVSTNGRIYLCALTRIGGRHSYIVVPLKENTYLEEADHVVRIDLKRSSEEMVGHVVTQDEHCAYLLTLWSHGKLFSYPLTGQSANPPPGTLLSVITVVNTNHPVVMTSLNDTTIAAYGADAMEEGAILMIYNVRFKLVQATQRLKLYTKEAKLWKVEDKLLLAANRHLAVAPFRLASQRIEAMVGSSKSTKAIGNESSEDAEIMVVEEMTVADWGGNDVKPFKADKRPPRSVSKEFSAMLNDGMSEAATLEELMPRLIESKDIYSICWCLENFNDVPEKILMDVLSFCLNAPDDLFMGVEKTAKRRISKQSFLDKILSVSYSDICLLAHLKRGLSFNEALALLRYLIGKMSAEEVVEKIDGPSEAQLLEWTCILLDSHYQQYLLSQDPQILNLMEKLSSNLEEHFQLMEEMQIVRAMLERVVNEKPLKPTPKDSNKFYSIVEVKLY